MAIFYLIQFVQTFKLIKNKDLMASLAFLSSCFKQKEERDRKIQHNTFVEKKSNFSSFFSFHLYLSTHSTEFNDNFNHFNIYDELIHYHLSPSRLASTYDRSSF